MTIINCNQKEATNTAWAELAQAIKKVNGQQVKEIKLPSFDRFTDERSIRTLRIVK